MRKAWVKCLSKTKNLIDISQFVEQLKEARAPFKEKELRQIFTCMNHDRTGRLALETLSKDAERDRLAGFHHLDAVGDRAHHETMEIHARVKVASALKHHEGKEGHRAIDPANRTER